MLDALLLCTLLAGDAARLSPETWDRVPGGKEVDAILGDWVLRNDLVVAVIADAKPNRHANMSVKHVQGAVIDFALRSTNNDQLSGFLPHRDAAANVVQAHRVELLKASGPEVVLRAVREATEKDPVEAVTDYVLRDGEPFLRISTRYRNTGSVRVFARLSDKMRCDQTFSILPAGRTDLVVFHDRAFHAAYGVARLGAGLSSNARFTTMFGAPSGTWIDYPELAQGDDKVCVLEPGAEVAIDRVLVAGRDDAGVRLAAAALLGTKAAKVEVEVTDPDRKPVAGADLVVSRGKSEVTAARTDDAGRATLLLPEGEYDVAASAAGRASAELKLRTAQGRLAVKLPLRSEVAFDVSDGAGRGIPCKVQFLGLEKTPTPDFGPKQRAAGGGNLWHSATGRFRVPVPAGRYALIVSRGPEHDAAFRTVQVVEGETATVAARLPRVVDTRGWISADFHNHSTPSGDNTTGLDDRLLCLAAEHLEFAAATEHNRIVTYKDRLKALGLEKLVATSDGLELTNSPLPVSHHNAFPLIHRPRTQDGGGPAVGPDPLAQMRKLVDADGASEKLIQQNHPDIGWLFYDADGDGTPDLGFGTAKYTHVIEVWRPTILTARRFEYAGAQVRNHRTFNWLQLLNQGYRIPAVANTDAHYCLHESGRIRTWVKCSTDDPAAVDEMEIVRQSKKGAIVMSNGPYLEVTLDGAPPGDEVRPKGPAALRIRVQCANWLDVDRVQVLVGGRQEPKLNWTRAGTPGMFTDGVVKFHAEIPLEFSVDTHVIVVAAGEGATIGPVMGPASELPIAISNPIWVDVDGGGVTPSKDTLDAPLPVKKEPR
jgi:hypothetical protein